MTRVITITVDADDGMAALAHAEGLAAEIECLARYDHWAARFRCLTEHLDAACDLLAGLVAAPGLPRSEFKRLVKARRAGARESTSSRRFNSCGGARRLL